MEIGPNADTAIQGGTFLTALTALLKGLYRDYKNGKSKERMEARFKEIHDRLRGHDQEIEAHALFDAKNYATRQEMTDALNRLDTKLDGKFENLNSNIITAIRDNNGHKRD